MALPVVAAAGGALAMRAGLPVLLGRAMTLARRLVPAQVATVATRTGITGGAGRIFAAMKNNKVMTALVLMELGSEGAELLSEMAASDKEIADMLERYGFTTDPVDAGTRDNLATQVDEMQSITDAANSVGGLRNLHLLRRVLSFSEDHFKLYDQLKVLAGSVR